MKVESVRCFVGGWGAPWVSSLLFLALLLIRPTLSVAQYAAVDEYLLTPQVDYYYQPVVPSDGLYYTYDNAVPTPVPERPMIATMPVAPEYDTDAIELVTTLPKDETKEPEPVPEREVVPESMEEMSSSPGEETSELVPEGSYYDAEEMGLVPPSYDTGLTTWPTDAYYGDDVIEIISDNELPDLTTTGIEEPVTDLPIECAFEPELLEPSLVVSYHVLAEDENEPEVFAAAPPTLDGSITDANTASRKLFQSGLTKGKNLVFYPQGVAHTLKVLYEASTEAGPDSERKVREELLLALPFLSNDDFIKSYTQRSSTGLTLNSYLYLMARAGLKLDLAFATRMKRDFGAKFGQAATATVSPSTLAKTINNWFATQTDKRIQGEVVSAKDFDRDKFAFVVASALTIDGTFARAFESAACSGSFAAASGSKTIRYLKRADSGMDTTPYYADEKLRAVKLPLKDNSGEVILVRAAERNKDVLDALGVDVASALEKVADAGFEDRSLILEVPQLTKLKSSMELQRPLEALEIKKLFAGPANSFRSMITIDHIIGISTFRQVSAISWSATGFEGAAATVAVASSRSAIPPVRFDAPYIAIIKANDGAILGLVYVANP